MKIGIVITNPNHHFEMTIEVARVLKSEGHEPYYVSLCEFRRMRTPEEQLESNGIPYVKQKPISEDLKPSSGASTLGSNQSPLRKVLRKVFWWLKLKSFISGNLRSADVVLMLNDTAFPGDHIAEWLKSKKIPFCLLQEGIRFPLPGEGASSYGGAGAKKLFSWGERSAQYFQSVAKPQTEVLVTGSPRFDQFLDEVRALRKPDQMTLGVFTNPIDDQGFCSKQQKLELFESFVERAAVFLKTEGIILGVKCHPREDINEYLALANKHIETIELDKDIKKAIGQVNAGIIMASTVGLELLGANRAIGQLEIPGHGWVFDYTESGAVLKIPLSGTFDLSGLFEQHGRIVYFNEHVRQGNSAQDIAAHLLSC